MSNYIIKLRYEGQNEVHRAYREALESIRGIGQKRREEVIKKVDELLKEKGE